MFLGRLFTVITNSALMQSDGLWWGETIIMALVAIGLNVTFAVTRTEYIRHRHILRGSVMGMTLVAMLLGCHWIQRFLTNTVDETLAASKSWGGTGAEERAAEALVAVADASGSGMMCGMGVFVPPLLLRAFFNTNFVQCVLYLHIANTVYLLTSASVYSTVEWRNGGERVYVAFQIMMVLMTTAALFISERSSRRGFLNQLRIIELHGELERTKTLLAQAKAERADTENQALILSSQAPCLHNPFFKVTCLYP
jgi:hypothetical protein